MNSILTAIREPDGFTVACEEPNLELFAKLAGAATIGVAAYGGIAHAAEGVTAIAWGAGCATIVAISSWTLAIPALIVLGALTGSDLSWRRALLASFVTVAFGGGALLASTPLVVLLEVATDSWYARHVIHAMVMFGVGSTSSLIFLRIMAALEGRRSVLHVLWISLFGTLFVHLSWLSQLFHFPV